MSFQSLILVFIGGGIGSVLRYMMSQWINSNRFIYVSTLVVNILASFLLGIFLQKLNQMNDQEWIRFLLIVGFCGGLSTFSTFSSENLIMIQQGRIVEAISYSLMSILICVISVWLGFKILKFT
ncbi:MAG: fluoride efflux transporter CrcB [Saprospiraceae bacterium]|nr:fluoride efflux transporter CrcB [Saprospiraceae bacterium]